MVVDGIYPLSPSLNSFDHNPAKFRFPTSKNQSVQAIPVRSK